MKSNVSAPSESSFDHAAIEVIGADIFVEVEFARYALIIIAIAVSTKIHTIEITKSILNASAASCAITVYLLEIPFKLSINVLILGSYTVINSSYFSSLCSSFNVLTSLAKACISE